MKSSSLWNTPRKAKIQRDVLYGARRFNNYIYARIIYFGGLGFLVTGISSWVRKDLFPFININEIQFFPQGLTICFYGTLAIILRLYLSTRRIFSIGRGFNEYNKEKQQIHIFRWGFPGKNRRLNFFYTFSEIKSLRLESQNQISNLDLYLCLKEERKILLMKFDRDKQTSPQKLEYISSNLAKFLNIILEEKRSRYKPVKTLHISISIFF